MEEVFWRVKVKPGKPLYCGRRGEKWAFGLPGKPPAPRGVYANQPSPFAAARRSVWKVFMLFLVALVAMAAVRLVPDPSVPLPDYAVMQPEWLAITGFRCPRSKPSCGRPWARRRCATFV